MAGAREDKLTTTQKDKLQELRDRKLDSVPVKVKSGLLDPTDFDMSDQAALRPFVAESDRICAVLVPFLNENFGRGGKYQWEVGLFLEGAPATSGRGGWKVLQVSMLGEKWSTQLMLEAGLHDHQGALAWAGRGRHDRHIVCVKTKQLIQQQQQAKEAHIQEQFSQPRKMEGVDSRFDVTEHRVQVPLHADPGVDFESEDEEGALT